MLTFPCLVTVFPTIGGSALHVEARARPLLLSALYGDSTMEALAILPKKDLETEDAASLFRYVRRIATANLKLAQKVEKYEA